MDSYGKSAVRGTQGIYEHNGKKGVLMMKITSIEDFNKYQQEKFRNKRMSNDQLIQATSEILLTAHFCEVENNTGMGLSIDTDVEVNPPSKKDIDIQICKADLTLNIEVKTPNQDVIEEGKFHGGLPHRYPGVERAEENPKLREISEVLQRQSGMESQILKTNDNRLKDFIDGTKGANRKFAERCNDSLNILAVICTSKQMGENLLYLVNPHSGLLTLNSYKLTDFSKIDYIVVSNAVEGITNGKEYAFDAKQFMDMMNLANKTG